MDSLPISPKTFTDLSLDQLKIGLGGRLSPRRLACVRNKYDLLKYLWKESQIDDKILEKYRIKNVDEISIYDDAFSRYLQDNRNERHYTGQNEYAKQRLNDVIQPIPEPMPILQQPFLRERLQERFPEKKFKIHKLIREDIGTKWRDFGRNLELKEGKLDSINYEHNEVESKVDEIFKVLQAQCLDEFMYVEKICNSLIDSRRKDLAKQVLLIMDGR